MSEKRRRSMAVIEADLCWLLKGQPTAEFLNSAPKWPNLLRVVQPKSGGSPIILRTDPATNSCKIISLKEAAGVLRHYVSGLAGDVAEYNVPFKSCVSIVESWSFQHSDLDELPKAVAFKSDPDLCLTRLDFDPVHVGDSASLSAMAPLFAEMLGRTENADAFAMRLGSMFDPTADRKQAVWMSGPPDSGKSQFAWLLMKLAGNSYGLLSNADFNTQFWKAQLVGKRVGIIQEATARFIRSDEFKAITGDDEHSINQKGVPIYNAKIPTLMFFFSNHAPEIPHDDALMTRIIDCRIKPIEKDGRLPTLVVRERLEEELPLIAGYCISRYMTINRGDRIPTGDETLRLTIEKYEAEYLDFLEHHFVAAPEECVTRRVFKTLMEEYGIKSSLDQSICKRVLLSHFPVREWRKSFDTAGMSAEKRVFVYQGIRERSEDEKRFYEQSGSPAATSVSSQKKRLQVVDLKG